ncbi:MAG: inositol monophosphatase [Rhodospirillales bacterium]|nr:inositol monophosphatase [Rhodospirillales bacterium]
MALRSALINVMANAASKVARRMVRDFGEVEQLQVSKKGPADFVSTADLRAERDLKAELKRARPKFGLLMEESGYEEGEDKTSRWIVDPLDGTTNFLHGIPHFAISIAAEVHNEIVAGVIYDPIRDETFWAEKGSGAYMNDRRLRVSARDKLPEAVFATGIPFHGRPGHSEFLSTLEHVMSEVAGVRRFGSAALDLAYVAAGRYEGFWENGLSYWDVAAGIIIVREAGGYVTDFQGESARLPDGEIVAANDKLHTTLRRLVAKSAKAAPSTRTEAAK